MWDWKTKNIDEKEEPNKAYQTYGKWKKNEKQENYTHFVPTK